MEIEDVLKKYEATLLTLPHVTGVGIGEREGKGVIIIFLDKPLAGIALAVKGRFPMSLEGFDVDVREAVEAGL